MEEIRLTTQHVWDMYHNHLDHAIETTNIHQPEFK